MISFLVTAIGLEFTITFKKLSENLQFVNSELSSVSNFTLYSSGVEKSAEREYR